MSEGPTLRLRPAGPTDAEAITAMIEELNAQQGDETGHVTLEAVRRDGFGPAPEFRVLVAELDGAPVGYALFHPSWSTEVGQRGFYLYDLYVRPHARGHGVGHALMAELAQLARSEGRTFLWWNSKDWNQEAQAFYRRLGAIEESVKAHAIFGEPFEALADAASPETRR